MFWRKTQIAFSDSHQAVYPKGCGVVALAWRKTEPKKDGYCLALLDLYSRKCFHHKHEWIVIIFSRGRRWSRESSSSSAMSPFRQASTSSVSSAGSTEMMEPSYSTRADDLPDKNADSLIARQALELLVSCLRLRSSHLGKSWLDSKRLKYEVWTDQWSSW